MTNTKKNKSDVSRETACALLGFITPRKSFTPVINESKDSSKKILPALLIPKTHPEMPKRAGDFDVYAGEDGTPELTKKYLAMTPGQVSEALNKTIEKHLQEQATMVTHFDKDAGGKLKSFDSFPVGRADLTDVAEKAATPMMAAISFAGTEDHAALRGTTAEKTNASTTVEMDAAKEQTLKKLSQFIASFHSKIPETQNSKEVM